MKRLLSEEERAWLSGLSSGKGGAVLMRLRVSPRASRSAITGIKGDRLALAVTSAPVDGEANKAVIDLLSKLLKLRKGAFSIEAGAKGRDKTVKVDGLSAALIASRIKAHII